MAAQIKQAVSLNTEDPFTDAPAPVPKVTLTHVKRNSGNGLLAPLIVTPASNATGLEEMRTRKNSDLIPGGAIDRAVPKLLEHCRVDEHKAFVPFFPPGRLLHLQVEKSNRCVCVGCVCG